MANAYALSGTNLLAFDTASPTSVTTIPITGINAGETLVAIDVRSQNGVLYGLGVNATSDTATLYIFARNGVASAVGTAGSVSLTTDGTTVVDLPDPATVGYGFDFNPAADRIRVTAGTLNFRINPNTGLAVDGDNTGLTSGTVTGTNPDGPINGGTTTVDGSAYTNNQPNNGGVTTLYTLDAASDSLFIQNPPNAGLETLVVPITLGGNPLNFTGINGFDIPAGVNTAASNAPVTNGSAFAVLNVGGATSLYSINLVNGQATLIGNVGNGTTAVQGLAVHTDLGGLPVIALDAAGANLLRFNTAAPGTVTTQALATGSLVAGETLIGIDYRPANGQLYAMGVNATADTGTLYLVDPQNGAISVVGSASGIAFTGIDLPDPATSGYGFDFNPDVDRIRVTTSTGLNFRVNPITGAGVDSDPLTAGTQPDSPINGSGSAGVSGAAYTNSLGNDVAVTATTLYVLDAASNKLFIQFPPNNGTETNGVVVTLGGNPLDFTDVSGFDIPASVRVTTSNSAATGFGFATLTVGGTTGLYQIDLATGVATALGAIGAGTTQIAGMTVGIPTTNVAIISNGGGNFANVAHAENTTAVTTVTTVQDATHFSANTFSITPGSDAAKFQINATTGALSFISAPDFEAPTDGGANNTYQVTVVASDGVFSDSQTIIVTVTDVNETTQVTGTQGDDVLNVPPDPSVRVDALGGVDTASFNFKLTDAIVSYVGNKVIFDTASQHIETTGIEKYVFTDGTVNNRDNDALVDDLFYYSHNHDVWNAHADADAHFHINGFKEGRDPSAFFDTSVYLAINPAVKAAGIDPLTHYSQIGWKEGLIPSLSFDPQAYLAANPDVKAGGAEPLAHFLTYGAGEGRQPIAPTEYLAPNGFDYVYYLQNNADVAAAGVDPFQHFQTVGWKEGRNPNALFDTNGYLAAYSDVANAHVNPLDHYHTTGFKEGRDPSVGFDTLSYRSAYPDVAAANVDPLAHFLDFGRHEGRSAFADGVFG